MTFFKNISQYMGKQQWNVKSLNGLEILKKKRKEYTKKFCWSQSLGPSF